MKNIRSACCLILADFLHGFLYDLEDGRKIFLRMIS
jgi:hypothetical protein